MEKLPTSIGVCGPPSSGWPASFPGRGLPLLRKRTLLRASTNCWSLHFPSGCQRKSLESRRSSPRKRPLHNWRSFCDYRVEHEDAQFRDQRSGCGNARCRLSRLILSMSKPCRSCKDETDEAATKCPKCQAYQQWYRNPQYASLLFLQKRWLIEKLLSRISSPICFRPNSTSAKSEKKSTVRVRDSSVRARHGDESVRLADRTGVSARNDRGARRHRLLATTVHSPGTGGRSV